MYTYRHFEQVIYVDNGYWECGFYNRRGDGNIHYLINIEYGIHTDCILPYNVHTEQYIGKCYDGKETINDI